MTMLRYDSVVVTVRSTAMRRCEIAFERYPSSLVSEAVM